MSTKLTRSSPKAGYDLVDSHALALTQGAGVFQQRLVEWLLAKLARDGFTPLSASQLSFLGTLDCGVNFASELARRLNISRQAIHKTVKEMEALGWLETRLDATLGNQRIIEFTTEGERMMSCARAHFAALDAVLAEEFGADALASMTRLMEFEPPVD